jgi:chemotaxis protein MotA
MSNLSDIGAVGAGIAGAFVATIYGVAAANILFLPLGGRIKLRLREEITLKELSLVGVLAIQEGMNPKLVRERLTEFVPHAKTAGHAAGGDAARAAAPQSL